MSPTELPYTSPHTHSLENIHRFLKRLVAREIYDYWVTIDFYIWLQHQHGNVIGSIQVPCCKDIPPIHMIRMPCIAFLHSYVWSICACIFVFVSDLCNVYKLFGVEVSVIFWSIFCVLRILISGGPFKMRFHSNIFWNLYIYRVIQMGILVLFRLFAAFIILISLAYMRFAFSYWNCIDILLLLFKLV